jgi:phenylpropionate dioxygenase-like ring-hydroxylating dioxygenase large terminal subunit
MSDNSGSADTRFRNYPLNSWYVGATSDEVVHRLLGRQLLDQPVLLFRQQSGEVAAFEDRCAHRSMPVSSGRLDGDRVVCRYHGFAYDATGECVLVPSQERVPYGARLRKLPVREDPPFVWIWLGDPARAESVSPPVVWWLSDPAWATFGGTFRACANYMLLHENSLDLTHMPFVHGERALQTFRGVPPPLEVEVSENSVSYCRVFPPLPLAQWQVRTTGLAADAQYEQREYASFVQPGFHIDSIEIVVPANGDGSASQILKKTSARAFTPEGPTSTHVFWRVGRNFATDQATVARNLRSVHEQIFKEDKELVEEIQLYLQRYGPMRRATVVNADIAGIKAHDIVQAMLARERGRADVRSAYGLLQPWGEAMRK